MSEIKRKMRYIASRWYKKEKRSKGEKGRGREWKWAKGKTNSKQWKGRKL